MEENKVVKHLKRGRDAKQASEDLWSLLEYWGSQEVDLRVAVESMLKFSNNLAFGVCKTPEVAVSMIQDALDNSIEKNVEDDSYKETYYSFYSRGKELH